MDLFKAWLSKKEVSSIKRALTSSSYKNRDQTLTNKDIADDLATLGDAVIKLCYAQILLDKEEQLSKKIEEFITDDQLVSKIAKHYNLLEFIRYDNKDEKIIKNYNYQKSSNGKTSPHKYIATCVEAIVGAIYLETKDIDSIIQLLKSWQDF